MPRRTSGSPVWTRNDASSTTSNFSPRSSPSIGPHIVRAPRTRSSISADSSTAVTVKPRSIRGWVMRPTPLPSSRMRAPAGATPAITSGSSPTGSLEYSSTAQPSGVIAPGPVPSYPSRI